MKIAPPRNEDVVAPLVSTSSSYPLRWKGKNYSAAGTPYMKFRCLVLSVATNTKKQSSSIVS